MKRILAIMLCLIMAVSAVACNKTEAPAPETTKAPEQTQAPATDAPATEAPTTEAEGGCGSVIGFSVIAVLAAAAAAVALKKD